MKAYLFGLFRLEQEGQAIGPFPTQKVRALCAYLLLNAHRVHPRLQLAGLFWGDMPEARALRNLSDAMWRLRRLIGDDFLIDDENLVHLNPDRPLWIDHDSFLRLTATPHFLAAAGDEARWDSLQQGAALYEGELLTEFYDDWALIEREHCRGRYLLALQALASDAEARGELLSALSHLEQMAREDPLNEETTRQLMRLYAITRRIPLAVERYRTLCRLLQTSLGVPPSAATLELYRSLEAEAAGRVRAGPVPGAGLPTLVGRGRERTRLLDEVQKAVAGLGGALLIQGEAGVGKTRLTQSVAEGAAWRGLEVRSAACQRGDMAYGPLIRTLSSGLTAHLVEWLKGRLPAEVRRILSGLSPELAQFSLEDGPPPISSGAFEAVSDVVSDTVLALSQRSPVLWVLEDVQWADSGTQHALTLLLPRLRKSRVCLLLTARRESLRVDPGRWQWLEMLERQGALQVVSLQSFSEDETEELAMHAVGSALDGRTRAGALHQVSGGNPLFILECLRGWQEVSASTPLDDYLARLPGTRTLESVLHERLAQLEPDARTLLQSAAVLGVEMPVDVLRAISPLPHERFLECFDELLRLGLFVERGGGCRFVHDLVRQASLSVLTAESLQLLHCRAAQLYQQLYPIQVETIAAHWEAGEAWELAITALHAAAQKAAATAALNVAVEFYDRALAALGRLPMGGDTMRRRLQLLEDKFQALELGSSARDQLVCAQECLDLARRLGETVRETWACIHLARAHFQLGNYDALRQAAASALDSAGRLGDRRLIAWALLSVGLGTEDFKHKRRLWEEAVQAFEALSDTAGLYWTAWAFGTLEMRVGRFTEAHAQWGRARDLAASLGWLRRRLTNEVNLTQVEFLIGLFEPALSRIQTVFAQVERLGISSSMASAAHLRALLYLATGQPGLALEWARRCCEYAEISGHRLTGLFGRLTGAGARCVLRDLDGALADARQAKEDAEAMGEVNSTATAHRWLAEIARAQGDYPASVEHAGAAARLAHTEGLLLLEMRACTQAAVTCTAQGLPDAAVQWIGRGLEIRQALAGYRVAGSEDLCFAAYQARLAAGQPEEAVAALQLAWREAAAKARAIHEPGLRKAYLAQPICTAIVETTARHALALSPALAWLPQAGASHSRAGADPLIPTIWTLDSAEDLPEPGPERRRRRLARLLAEAEDQGADPRYRDFIEVLEVSKWTLRTDLRALGRSIQGDAQAADG